MTNATAVANTAVKRINNLTKLNLSIGWSDIAIDGGRYRSGEGWRIQSAALL
jgi:hypothetical protein